MSTQRTSERDWIDVWVTPYEDNLQLTIENDFPDLNGPPKRAIHVRMDAFNGGTMFKATIYDNHQPVHEVARSFWGNYDDFLTPDPARRDTFELRVTPNHLRFGMPAYNKWWQDSPMPTLAWTAGVVQFGHHSYTPDKDCAATSPCKPNTWHWDNVSITPSIPFTIVRGDQRYAEKSTSTITLPSPAPANGHLRFAGIGDKLQVSFNGGSSWTNATRQAQLPNTQVELFKSFWMPIPAGTTKVQFRGSATVASDWMVRDVSVFAR